MDEKKVREAIEVIKGYRRLDEYMNNTKRLPYCDIAIEALEKQLPKKGIKEKITEGVNKGLHKFYCPVCYKKGDLSNKCNVGEYCSDCGQKISRYQKAIAEITD